MEPDDRLNAYLAEFATTLEKEKHPYHDTVDFRILEVDKHNGRYIVRYEFYVVSRLDTKWRLKHSGTMSLMAEDMKPYMRDLRIDEILEEDGMDKDRR